MRYCWYPKCHPKNCNQGICMYFAHKNIMIISTMSWLHILYINIGIRPNSFCIGIFWTCTSWCWTTISKEHFYHDFIIRVLLDWRTLLLKAMHTHSIRESSISLMSSYVMFIYIYLKQSGIIKWQPKVWVFGHFLPSPNFEVLRLVIVFSANYHKLPKSNPRPIIKMRVIL